MSNKLYIDLGKPKLSSLRDFSWNAGGRGFKIQRPDFSFYGSRYYEHPASNSAVSQPHSRQVYKKGVSMYTCVKIFQTYKLFKLSDGYAQGTMDLYMWVLSLMDDYLQLDVDEITPSHLRQFMLYLRTDYKTRTGKPLSPSSIQNAWKALRSFWGWCEQELGLDNPAQDLPLPRVPPSDIKPLTHDDIFALIGKAGLRDKAIILLLLDSGVRVGELCRILHEHCNWTNGAIFITPHGSGSKTKSRMVYISRPTIKACLRYLLSRDDDNPHLFLSKNHVPMNRNSVRLAMRRLGESAGVNVHPDLPSLDCIASQQEERKRFLA
jgi:integrase